MCARGVASAVCSGSLCLAVLLLGEACGGKLGILCIDRARSDAAANGGLARASALDVFREALALAENVFARHVRAPRPPAGAAPCQVLLVERAKRLGRSSTWRLRRMDGQPSAASMRALGFAAPGTEFVVRLVSCRRAARRHLGPVAAFGPLCRGPSECRGLSNFEMSDCLRCRRCCVRSSLRCGPALLGTVVVDFASAACLPGTWTRHVQALPTFGKPRG